jgi:tripartite-type tricarboxylate transporter receptor subunit TctC
MSNLQRSLRTLAFGLLAAFMLAPAKAQTWPQRPVKFVLPIGPGAGVDFVARILAERLTERWGQPVVVENRPGGDSFFAITAVASANDDHVLLFSPATSFTAHPYLHAKVPYDVRDLVPIARVTNTIVVLAVPTSLNVNSLKELVALLRAEPGKFNWATATGANDLLLAGFLKSENLEMTKVSYRDTVQAVTDLAQGRIDVYIAALAIVRPQVQAGKVKLLAITNRQRAPNVDVPTSAEAGFPLLTLDGLVGLLGPRKMTSELRERIAADVRAIAGDSTIAARLAATGQVVNPGSPGELAAAIEEQRASVAAIGKVLGIQPAQ